METLQEIKEDLATSNSIGAAMLAVAGLFVCLRILSRPWLKIRLGADDIFICASMAFFIIQSAFKFVSVSQLEEAKEFNSPSFRAYSKYGWISGIFYFAAGAFFKISVLCMYRRLFCTLSSYRFHRTSLALIILTVLWALAGVIVKLLECIPLRAIWDPRVKVRHIIADGDFLIAILVIELILDTTIISLPFRNIARLRLSMMRKILLSLVFALASLSIIVCVLRLGFEIKDLTDRHGHPAREYIWSDIHLGTAIVCACLPTLRPLWLKIISSLLESFRSLTTSRSGRMNSGMGMSQEMLVAQSRQTLPQGSMYKEQGVTESSSASFIDEISVKDDAKVITIEIF